MRQYLPQSVDFADSGEPGLDVFGGEYNGRPGKLRDFPFQRFNDLLLAR
jgi:hypothetical protein